VSDLKHIQFGGVALLLLGMVIALTGIVFADPGVNATPETQSLSTVTAADVIGLAMESDAATWTLSSADRIYTNWGRSDDPADFNDSYATQYTTAYDANIVAQGGHAVIVKTMNIDTRNKVTSQSNINAQTGLTFAATDNGGNVVGSENLMIDGVSDSIFAYDKVLCPFVTEDSAIPYLCNIVQAGSKYDLTIGSVTTNANERFVGTDAKDPVVLNYAINVKQYGISQGQIPASGSTMAYLKTHVQEGRDYYYFDLPGGVWAPVKAEDLTYSESSSAQGTITTFNKEFGYSSQVTGFVQLIQLL
jgi:hypothetical protein